MILDAILLLVAILLNLFLCFMYDQARSFGKEGTVNHNVFGLLMMVDVGCWIGAVLKALTLP